MGATAPGQHDMRSNVTATSSSGAELRGAKIAIVGVGKIACDQHIPAIAGLEAFELAATASRAGGRRRETKRITS